MTSQLHEWILSGLSLVTDDAVGRPSSGYWFQTYSDGLDLGEPEPSNSIRETLALDGDDVVTDRWGNREIVFTTAIYGYTAQDIADGERELAQRIGVPGVLEFLPPESGPRTLYRVLTSKLKPLFDDLRFVQGDKYVAYQVTLNCAPWAYPETVITETFSPGTPTITVGDACASNANWSGLTAVTFLGQSAVRLGPITASASGGHPSSVGLIGVTYGVASSITFSGTVAAANFMYLDYAATLSGFGDMPPPYIVGQGSPIASQLQADGYMRYFWRRQAGPLTIQVFAFGMASGDTATFYVDEFGTSDLLPSGSLLVLSTTGSVRSEANLRITRTDSSSGLGETLVYADPTMLTNGWAPNVGTTFANAPDGTYWIYAQPTAAYIIGDVFTATVAGQTVTTRVEHSSTDSHWVPFGPFNLGGRKSRRLGAVTGITATASPTIALLKNGVGTGYTLVAMRLFRESPDTALVHVWLSSPTANNSLFIEPASIDTPQPGVFAGSTTTGSDATSVLSLVKSWGWPHLIPPITALFVQAALATTTSVTVTHRPPFHSLAAED